MYFEYLFRSKKISTVSTNSSGRRFINILKYSEKILNSEYYGQFSNTEESLLTVKVHSLQKGDRISSEINLYNLNSLNTFPNCSLFSEFSS